LALPFGGSRGVDISLVVQGVGAIEQMDVAGSVG
jgi:hypothetical protein